MIKKLSLIILTMAMCISFSAIAEDGPYKGKTKEAYFKEISSVQDESNSKNKSLQKSAVKEDWGSCRDTCYNGRNDCYNLGGETERCESIYDGCTARCDAKH
jgi:hypothetical protein